MSTFQSARAAYDRVDFALGHILFGAEEVTDATTPKPDTTDFFPCYREPEKSRL